MIIYNIRYTDEYFFCKEDAERKVEEFQKQGFIFLNVINEVFIKGHNPFINNQELID